MRQLTCAGCGRRFGCGVDSGSCWCAEVSLDAPTRQRLTVEHADCLCRSCLEAGPGPEEQGGLSDPAIRRKEHAAGALRRSWRQRRFAWRGGARAGPWIWCVAVLHFAQGGSAQEGAALRRVVCPDSQPPMDLTVRAPTDR
ncbi:MAG: cysteine-rich CWC family protein [Actinomycetota bacterium]|nr:cysteine-rich CWC family protein [Actinomycetota bacterium]